MWRIGSSPCSRRNGGLPYNGFRPLSSRLMTAAAMSVLLSLLLGTSVATASSCRLSPRIWKPKLSVEHRPIHSSDAGSLLDLRGGATPSRRKKSKSASLSSSSSKSATGKRKVGAGKAEGEKKKTLTSWLAQEYKKMKPLMKAYITSVIVVTMLGLLLGEELCQGILAFDPISVFSGMQLWRPFTAAFFLGPPSLSWLTSGYYLCRYGSFLEGAYGTAQFLVFFLSQLALLSVFSSLFLGQPFFATSMTTAMLHVLSRATPYVKVRWIVVDLPMWTLPYGNIVADVLQAQNLLAAVPHVAGILCGHFYQFHKFIWPRMAGADDWVGSDRDWLAAPNFLRRLVEPESMPTPDDGGRRRLDKALKSRKRKKGRKLGS